MFIEKNMHILYCLKCKSDHVFPFKMHCTFFRLNAKVNFLVELFWKTVYLKSQPTVCLDCGYLWSEIDKERLNSNIKDVKSHPKTTNHECFRCRKANIYSGELFHPGDEHGSCPTVLLIPNSKFKITLSDRPYIAADKESFSCLDCGLVWSMLSLSNLHMQIKKWSNNKTLLKLV
jgi:hypothetical protein